MLIIPFEVKDSERGPLIIIMILEKENLDRMKEADPFDVHFSSYSNYININYSVKELDFIIAYEEDTNKILEFKRKNDIFGLLKWIQRGRKILPGDVTSPILFRKN